MSLLVFENTKKSHRQKIFTLFGVDYYITKRTWINLPLMLSVGIVYSLLFSPENQFAVKILNGLGYGFLIMLSMFSHGLGHIISSKMVDAPISSIIMTATVNVIQFDDSDEKPSRIHVGRSLGGPIFNLLLGFLAIAISQNTAQNIFLIFFGWLNIALGGITLLPIPSLDGPVIIRELRDWKK